MDPLDLINIRNVITMTTGHPRIIIGIVDGPVDKTHPDLIDSNIQIIPVQVQPKSSTDTVYRTKRSLQDFANAQLHGTFVAGIISGRRQGSSPGICPGCSLIVRPVFFNSKSNSPPLITPSELGESILELINAGAKIINLSLGLSGSTMHSSPELLNIFKYALDKGVILVAASGNNKHIGSIPLFDHPWIIPVAACDAAGNLDQSSNIGPSTGRGGLMAPGIGITSTAPEGRYISLSGTSAAAPFVSGSIALIWSIFQDASAFEIRKAFLQSRNTRATIIPPLLNVDAVFRILNSVHRQY